jgi:hypothetical protein
MGELLGDCDTEFNLESALDEIAALRARIEVLEKVAEVAANSFHWDGCDCGACSHFWSVYRKAKEG